MEMNKFTVVKEVLHNNYQSRNLIGHYHFWVIKPKKFNFVHLIVSHYAGGTCGWGTRQWKIGHDRTLGDPVSFPDSHVHSCMRPWE